MIINPKILLFVKYLLNLHYIKIVKQNGSMINNKSDIHVPY